LPEGRQTHRAAPEDLETGPERNQGRSDFLHARPGVRL